MIQVAMTMALGLALILAPLTAAPVAAQGAAPAQVVFPTDRTVLPIPEPQYPHSTVFDVRNATPPPRFEVKAPAKAPNVLIVLIDDMGFGQSSYGGTRNGMVIHWPTGIAAKGQVRSQWHHVIDIAPTILEAAGLPEPKSVNGTPQTPIEGVSMAYTFADTKAPSRHTTQYFEIFGNRAIYNNGWLAGTVHRAAWEIKPRTTLENDAWELYDSRTDFSLANDLAARNPEKLKELQALFLKEAVKYSVLPIDDRSLERLNAALVGRPDLMAGRTSLTVYQGMTGMSENVFINVKNRSHTITAEVEIPKRRREGRPAGPGRAFRRLEPLREGWQADVHLQLAGPAAVHGGRQAGVARREGDDPLRVRL